MKKEQERIPGNWKCERRSKNAVDRWEDTEDKHKNRHGKLEEMI